MKKLFLTVMVAFSALVSAQEKQEKNVNGNFEKDDIYVSGSFGFDNSSTSVGSQDISNNNFTFSPSVGYFISENIALELGLNFGNRSSEIGNQKIKNGVFGVNLGGRYFFTPQDNFSFTLGAAAFYSSASQKSGGVEGPDTNVFGLSVAPGVNYFISESFALRASVGALSYSSSKVDVSGASSTNNFGFNVNLSDINFGLTYKF